MNYHNYNHNNKKMATRKYSKVAIAFLGLLRVWFAACFIYSFTQTPSNIQFLNFQPISPQNTNPQKSEAAVV